MKRVSAPVEAYADNENLTHRRYRAAIAGFVTYTARLIYNNSRRLPGGNFSLKPSPPPGGYPIQVLPNGGYLGNLYRHYKNDLTGPASGLCLSPRELKLWPIDQTILPSACPNGASRMVHFYAKLSRCLLKRLDSRLVKFSTRLHKAGIGGGGALATTAGRTDRIRDASFAGDKLIQ